MNKQNLTTKYISGKLKIKVAFIASGYPSVDHPNQSIFIHRSIQKLIDFAEVRVIHFRAWLPGRPFFERKTFEDIPVLTIFCPQSPRGGMSHLNTNLLSHWGFPFAKSCLEDVDIIHSTDLYPAGFIGSKWSEKLGKPHTSHAIGADVYRFLPHNFSRINKEWLDNIQGVACTSQAILEKVRQLFPSLINSRVIYRGVNSRIFTPEGFINGPQFNLSPVRFMYLGGFHSWDPDHPFYTKKGGHFLLDAWKQVETDLGLSSLFIGGPGCDLEKLELWRKNLKRPDAVYFSKPVTPAEIPPLIRSCDVIVIPSDHEGLPNVANEAQACGRPVLGTDAGGIPESVIHEKTGYIVPHGQSKSLAEGLKWFNLNQEKIPVLGSNAREHMVNDWDQEQFPILMLDLFQKAIEIYRTKK